MNAPVETLLNIALSNIIESPTNPRKRFDPVALQELADSIKGKGLIEPAIVRPLPTGIRGHESNGPEGWVDDGHGFYELVVGARRFRASGLAGRTTLLCIVRDLTDREVCEIQLEENGQRADVHPLEEADAYQHLHAKGAALEELAARTGKSVQYVALRLVLAKLCPEAREVYFKGVLSHGAALAIARMPRPDLQAELVREASHWSHDGEPVGAATVRSTIVRRYTLRLAAAPFDVADVTLVPVAGSCAACPKRSGNQPALFEEITDPETCLDVACHRTKASAAAARKLDAAAAKGHRVIRGDEAKKLVEYGQVRTDKLNAVDLDRQNYDDPKHRTYRELLKGIDAPLIIVENAGTAQEFVGVKELPKLLKKAGHDFERDRQERDEKRAAKLGAGVAKTPEQTLEEKVREQLPERLRSAVVDAVQASPLPAGDAGLWRWVTKVVIACALPESLAPLVKARTLPKMLAPDTSLCAHADSLSPAECRALIAEVAMLGVDEFGSDLLRELVFDHHHVDAEAIEKALRAELAPPPKPAPEKASSKKPGKSTAKTAGKSTPKAAKAGAA